MKVYLAGPMRGRPEFNFPAFLDAGRQLRAWGHEVFNPAERDLEHGFEPEGLTGHESLDRLDFDLRAAMVDDLTFVAKHADAIALLPGWSDSRGVRAELATAAALGLSAGPVEAFDPDAGQALRPAADLLATLDNRLYDQVAFFDTLAAPVWAPSVNEHLRDTAAAAEHAVGKDGEVRVTSTTGGQKGRKPARFDLIPAEPLWKVAEVYGKGAEKYADRNWELGYPWDLSFGAMQRHAWAFWNGEDTDAETGLPHLASVVFHAFALMEFARTHPEFDTRPATARREAA